MEQLPREQPQVVNSNKHFVTHQNVRFMERREDTRIRFKKILKSDEAETIKDQHF